MPKIYSYQSALLKIKQFCVYRERAHTEVNQKLYLMGANKKDRDNMLATLIEENYLNEERYARQYASGKSSIKKWGIHKIVYSLQKNNVNEYCINKAINLIDKKKYEETLFKLAEKKLALLKTGTPAQRKQKLYNYLYQKGYEPILIYKAIHLFFD